MGGISTFGFLARGNVGLETRRGRVWVFGESVFVACGLREIGASLGLGSEVQDFLGFRYV